MSSSGNPSSSGGAGGGGGPCGACKFLRRKCVAGCIFAPHFDSEQGAAHFAAVHKVFGASNVSKLLHHIPEHKRQDAVATICFEAQARHRDPVYGCVAHIISLQQQVVNLQAELSYTQAQLATIELPQPQQPPTVVRSSPPPLSISDLPALSQSVYDISSIFDPMSSTWAMQQHQHLQRPSDILFSIQSMGGGGGGGEFQAIEREFFRGGQMGAQSPPGTSGAPTSTLIKRE